MTDPTPATPDEPLAYEKTDVGVNVFGRHACDGALYEPCLTPERECIDHPATPDEAVAALAEALDGSVAATGTGLGTIVWEADEQRIIERLADAGWSLSRKQGDAVAARVEEPTSTEDRSMTGPYECAAWPKCAHPCLREGEAIVSVEDVARRLADGKARIDGAMWHQWDEGTRDHYRAEASRLLGIGADGAGDGR